MSTTARPPSIGWELNATNFTTIILAFIFVSARVITKFFITRSPGWDDYTSILALCFGIGRTINDTIGVEKYGMGHHFKDVRPDQINGFIVSIGVDTVLYYCTIALAKLAIVIFLYRIFSIDRRFRWACRFLGALLFLWAFLFSIISICACRPFIAKWNFTYLQEHPKSKCIDVSIMILYYGWWNTVTDFVLIILPMPMIWKMQMATGKKLGVAVVFASGIIVFAISIYRLDVLYFNNQSPDITWLIIQSKIWLTIEVNLAIITGCLPSLQPLFRRTFQISSDFFSSARGSGGSKPSFVMQQPPGEEPRRDYSRAEMGLPLRLDDKRSTSVGERSEVGSEQSVSAMYHAKGTYREVAEDY